MPVHTVSYTHLDVYKRQVLTVRPNRIDMKRITLKLLNSDMNN